MYYMIPKLMPSPKFHDSIPTSPVDSNPIIF